MNHLVSYLRFSVYTIPFKKTNLLSLPQVLSEIESSDHIKDNFHRTEIKKEIFYSTTAIQFSFMNDFSKMYHYSVQVPVNPAISSANQFHQDRNNH